jgi:hypothetical protein
VVNFASVLDMMNGTFTMTTAYIPGVIYVGDYVTVSSPAQCLQCSNQFSESCNTYPQAVRAGSGRPGDHSMVPEALTMAGSQYLSEPRPQKMLAETLPQAFLSPAV